MAHTLRIGTRESQLAVYQATLVQSLLKQNGVDSELVFIKSDGDLDLITPLYALGVQGVFTKTLDAALLSNRIDIAVHSMKDVPTQMAQGLTTAAVLKRANPFDILVLNEKKASVTSLEQQVIIGTGSIRRKAQWLNRYPHHNIENLRGNVNTRLEKVYKSPWYGGIFAAAGLERTELKPTTAIELDWMLPAPAQGAIMIACRATDSNTYNSVSPLNDAATATCVEQERIFLNQLMGGCSTPISAYAYIKNDELHFEGNIFSIDGKEKLSIAKTIALSQSGNVGKETAHELLQKGADRLITKRTNEIGR